MPALSIHDIRKVFPGGVVALDRIDLDITAGEFLAILGPSGCGKSTLLRIIAGLDRQTAGSVTLDPVAAPNGVAFVFQDPLLLPWRNLLRNVALPLELRGMGRSERLDRASDAIAAVALSDAISRYPAQLSGGMRMRASLARAMVTRPRLLLLDEPFAALDEITRQQLDQQLRDLWLAQKMTVIFVTHSIAEATFLARRAVVMSPRPGRIILDHEFQLPELRTAELRTDPAFSREMRVLFDALRKGGAA